MELNLLANKPITLNVTIDELDADEHYIGMVPPIGNRRFFLCQDGFKGGAFRWRSMYRVTCGNEHKDDVVGTISECVASLLADGAKVVVFTTAKELAIWLSETKE